MTTENTEHQVKNGFTEKKCPKCGGNLYLDRDYYFDGGFISWYNQVSCLQCGFNHSVMAPPQKATTPVTAARTMPAKKRLVAV
jgi:predicted nucleic-acid-binding Zn-ribbon protein